MKICPAISGYEPPSLLSNREKGLNTCDGKYHGASVRESRANGCPTPTELKQHLVLCTLCIHFVISKELDFAKIWICPNTNPLWWLISLPRKSGHMQKAEVIDGLNQKENGSNSSFSRHWPLQHAPAFSDIGNHSKRLLLTDAGWLPFDARGQH